MLERDKDSADKEELRIEAEKRMVTIRRKLLQYGLELDADLDDIVKGVAVDGLAITGLEKVLDKDFIIRKLLQTIHNLDERSSTRQRALEFLAELLGVVPKGSTSDANRVIDVTVGTLNEE